MRVYHGKVAQIVPDLCYVGEHVCFLTVTGSYYHSFMYINYVFHCSPWSLPADACQSFVCITIVFMLKHCHRSQSAMLALVEKHVATCLSVHNSWF
jgi:hypothetical protein